MTPRSAYGRPHKLLRLLHTGAAINHPDEGKLEIAAEETGCHKSHRGQRKLRTDR